MRWRGSAAALAAVLALAAGGCGGDDDGDTGANAKKFPDEPSKDVAVVLDRLTTAARDGDAKEICEEIFSPEFAQRVIQETSTCEGTVEANYVADDASFLADDIRVEGSAAAARVTDRNGGQSLIRFESQDGSWRIVRIRTP